jgi:hypothetical protein
MKKLSEKELQELKNNQKPLFNRMWTKEETKEMQRLIDAGLHYKTIHEAGIFPSRTFKGIQYKYRELVGEI